MFKVRHGVYIALLVLLVTVAYANNPAENSPAPLGVVPKGDLKDIEPVSPDSTGIAPEVPAIPSEMPDDLLEAALNPAQSPETREGEGKTGKIAKRKVSSGVFTMPVKDRRVVDTAIREATRRPANSVNSESKTVYSYTPDAIYTLYGAPGRVIDIQLQPGEKLTGPVIAGDTVRWVVGTSVSRNGASAITHVLVKPVQAGIETNFIITTDRRSYHLIAKSLNRSFLPTVSWTYPHEEMAKFDAYNPDGQKAADMLASGGISPDKLNFKYTIDPDDNYSWTPVRVFDDGSRTYIQMSPEMKNTQAPVFFIKDEDGLNLVNYRVRGDYYVVDRLFEEGEFRCGKDEIVKIEKDRPWSLFGS
ncbi:MAG: P-type conjugative transfer protein TrbG [Desulfobulbus sp.]|nr:P-type conjugative transfer protein TrbG [Desulfobulbus sp.]